MSRLRWFKAVFFKIIFIRKKGVKKMENKTLQRVNSRLGYTQNAWLDDESKRTGISKSSLIQIAVEQYISQKQALNAMNDMTSLVGKLEFLETEIKKIQNVN